MKAEYKVGLFGVGTDGHTAGILPGSVAVHSKDLTCSYDTPYFAHYHNAESYRELDEAIVWMQGKDKWKVLEDLSKNEIDIEKQPAQY